jgi:hypothetical protein
MEMALVLFLEIIVGDMMALALYVFVGLLGVYFVFPPRGLLSFPIALN